MRKINLSLVAAWGTLLGIIALALMAGYGWRGRHEAPAQASTNQSPPVPVADWVTTSTGTLAAATATTLPLPRSVDGATTSTATVSLLDARTKLRLHADGTQVMIYDPSVQVCAPVGGGEIVCATAGYVGTLVRAGLGR